MLMDLEVSMSPQSKTNVFSSWSVFVCFRVCVCYRHSSKFPFFFKWSFKSKFILCIIKSSFVNLFIFFDKSNIFTSFMKNACFIKEESFVFSKCFYFSGFMLCMRTSENIFHFIKNIFWIVNAWTKCLFLLLHWSQGQEMHDLRQNGEDVNTYTKRNFR